MEQRQSPIKVNWFPRLPFPLPFGFGLVSGLSVFSSKLSLFFLIGSICREAGPGCWLFPNRSQLVSGALASGRPLLEAEGQGKGETRISPLVVSALGGFFSSTGVAPLIPASLGHTWPGVGFHALIPSWFLRPSFLTASPPPPACLRYLLVPAHLSLSLSSVY